ncbi:reverse transcriptase family protein [Halobacteriovorax marinus]|uniref:reverse transcriptase family protein n=1 Tax=Halobacteriovorax marinus TaxID=97084 RepID=UPI003A8D82D3
MEKTTNPLLYLESKKKMMDYLYLNMSIPKIKSYIEQNNYIIRTHDKITKKNQKKVRHIQEPKKELKKIHKRLCYLLSLRAFPIYLHSGVRNRSYKSNAMVHIENDFVVNIDIEKYFPSCKVSQVYRLFTEKYFMSKDVAHILSSLSTWCGVIPTGSPLSQLLAFLVSEDMFNEVSDYCQSNMLHFSVYVDDITLSSKNPISNHHIKNIVTIIEKYEFTINKSKLKRFDKYKAKEITGVVIHNKKLFVPFKRKKKIIELICSKPVNLPSAFGCISEVQFIEGSSSLSHIRNYIKKSLFK